MGSFQGMKKIYVKSEIYAVLQISYQKSGLIEGKRNKNASLENCISFNPTIIPHMPWGFPDNLRSTL